MPTIEEVAGWKESIIHILRALQNVDDSLMVSIDPLTETGFLNGLCHFLGWGREEKKTIMYGLLESESIVAFISASGEAYASLSGKNAVLIGTDRCPDLIWNQPILAFKGRASKITPLSTLVCQRIKILPTVGLWNQLMRFENCDDLLTEIQEHQATIQRSKVERYKNGLDLVNFGKGWKVSFDPPETSDDEMYAPSSDDGDDDDDEDDSLANNQPTNNMEDGVEVVTERPGLEID